MPTPPPAGRGHTPWRITRLRVARLFGASVVAVLGQFAVDMPDGWFGGSDVLTTVGAAYAAVVAVATLAEALLQFRRRIARGRPTLLTPLLLSLNVGAFVPALATDPTMAGIVVLWQLVALARHFLDRPKPLARRALARHFDPDAPAQAWLARYGHATRHLVVVALAAWLAVVGYDMSHHWLARLTCLVANVVPIWLIARFVLLLVREGRRWPALLGAPLVVAAASAVAGDPVLALSALAVFQAAAFGLLVRHSPTFRELAKHFYTRPALFVVNTFGALVVFGALVLTFPVSSATGRPLDPVDAFFTATSAVCVTGLIVVDTPVAFSEFGHVVILGLIQVGGLGIMVLSTFATLLLGGRLHVREERALGEMLDAGESLNVQRVTLFIVITTLGIEALGAALLFPSFRSLGLGAGEALWRACFHSVSAFCNAGFALQSDSLVAFRGDGYTLGVVALLITLGGLGFAVLMALWGRLRGERRGRWALGVRLVLWASGVLLVTGTVFYAALEWNRTLAGLPWWQKLLNAAFQSVTLRTAGFNSVDFAALATPTALLMCLFMVIGASPGGTGGGIKTTTTAVLLLAIPAIARGETRVTLFGRAVPQSVVYRSAAIAVITLGLALLGMLILSGTQTISLEQTLFEVSSAIGTVGLSIGATSALDPLGKYVVAAIMFVGRVGPLTLALFMGRPQPRRARFPEEDITVG